MSWTPGLAQAPRKILLLHLRRIGDAVPVTPALRGAKFDLVFDFQSAPPTALLALATGAHTVVRAAADVLRLTKEHA